MGLRSALIVPLVVGDRCLGALSFCFDISHRSHTEQALELAQERAQRAAIAVYNMRLYRQALEREKSLRESDRRKDEFLAVLAHEQRGPLAPLRNGLHLLRLSTGGDSALARPMEIMERQLRIVVVDDQADSADSLAALPSLMGHQVQKAYGGFEAVARFEAGRFDVVFMDIGMPEMDGLEASRRIRALPGGERVRIVALTGWGQSADRARTRAAGIDQHLVKPVALEDLQRSLEPDADRQSPRRDSLDLAL